MRRAVEARLQAKALERVLARMSNKLSGEEQVAIRAAADALRCRGPLVEALEKNMAWIGSPPTGPESFDSAREDAWKAGLAALALAKECP